MTQTYQAAAPRVRRANEIKATGDGAYSGRTLHRES
jgi:hypothetical protein